MELQSFNVSVWLRESTLARSVCILPLRLKLHLGKLTKVQREINKRSLELSVNVGGGETRNTRVKINFNLNNDLTPVMCLF